MRNGMFNSPIMSSENEAVRGEIRQFDRLDNAAQSTGTIPGIIKGIMSRHIQDVITENSDENPLSSIIAAVNEDDCNGNDVYDEDNQASLNKAIACKEIAEALGYKVNLESQAAFTLDITR